MNDTNKGGNDSKFLGLCILLAALMISAAIIWCTKANVDAMAELASANGASGSGSTTANVSSVTITGPVTLAPFTAPIPVTISTPDAAPITVKEVPTKQWTR
jgi:hypothetical protein